MPAVKTRNRIAAWREHALIRELAVGDRTVDELASVYGVQPNTIYDFKSRRKADIADVLAEWADEHDGVWATKVENRINAMVARYAWYQDRIDELEEQADAQTEEIQRDFPDAARVLVNGPEVRAYCVLQDKLLHSIAEQCGQLPTRQQPPPPEGVKLFHTIEGVDLQKALGLVEAQQNMR